MNVFKKIVAVATAAFTCLGGLQAFSAGAFEPKPVSDAFTTWYRMSDINRNGTTNTTDASIMSNVLWANRYVANNQLMDADGNHVISWADHKHIVAESVGNNSFNYVDGLTGSGFCGGWTTNVYTPSGQTLSRTYRKHVYSTNTDSTYALSMTETPFPTTMSDPDSIIGSDDRVPQSSSNYASGIVYLSNGMTGFVVDDHVIATAAHCVYDRNNNSWTSGYFMFPEVDASGNLQVNTATATKYYFKEAHIENQYVTDSHYLHYKDYALITVSADLKDRYHFSLGIPYNMYDSPAFGDYNLYITGYPSEYTSGGIAHMYTGYGKLYTDNGYDPSVLCYNTDTTGGNNGGPIYIKENVISTSEDLNLITVIGIHDGTLNSSANYGTYFTPMHLKFYYNNPYISY